MPKIILASSSSYRRDLLLRIINDFDVISPNIDESMLSGEDARATALRLADEKAKKLLSIIRKHLL